MRSFLIFLISTPLLWGNLFAAEAGMPQLNPEYWASQAFWLIIIFLSSIVISGYHIGIENNIFLEFSGCTNENLNSTDKTELLNSLNSYLPNCKDINFKIFGISLATINFILSIALVLITIKYFVYEKNK